MLKRKLFRDIWKNKSQFITIFLMVLIGVMVYSGIESYMDGMNNSRTSYYTDYNVEDLYVLGSSFTNEDLKEIESIDNVNSAEKNLNLLLLMLTCQISLIY